MGISDQSKYGKLKTNPLVNEDAAADFSDRIPLEVEVKVKQYDPNDPSTFSKKVYKFSAGSYNEAVNTAVSSIRNAQGNW